MSKRSCAGSWSACTRPNCCCPNTLPSDERLARASTRWPAWRFEPGRCQESLLRHFEVARWMALACAACHFAIRAAGAILQYLQETQPAALKLLTGLSTYSLDEFMTLDAATRRNLELTETIRESDDARFAAERARPHRHSDGQAPDAPVGQQAAAGYLRKSAAARMGWPIFWRKACCGPNCAAALKPLADLERLINRIIPVTPAHAT